MASALTTTLMVKLKAMLNLPMSSLNLSIIKEAARCILKIYLKTSFHWRNLVEDNNSEAYFSRYNDDINHQVVINRHSVWRGELQPIKYVAYFPKHFKYK